jgi:hypothetical protein
MSINVWITAVLMLLTGFSCEKLKINGDVPEWAIRIAKSPGRDECSCRVIELLSY